MNLLNLLNLLDLLNPFGVTTARRVMIPDPTDSLSSSSVDGFKDLPKLRDDNGE
jgi:hypothetical protein